jgi:hypothetical protein
MGNHSSAFPQMPNVPDQHLDNISHSTTSASYVSAPTSTEEYDARPLHPSFPISPADDIKPTLFETMPPIPMAIDPYYLEHQNSRNFYNMMQCMVQSLAEMVLSEPPYCKPHVAPLSSQSHLPNNPAPSTNLKTGCNCPHAFSPNW